MDKASERFVSTVTESCVYGVVSLCVLVVAPERILYDGVSGVVLGKVSLQDQAPAFNKQRLQDVNVLVDVLVGLLVLPLAQCTVYNFISTVRVVGFVFRRTL